MKSFPHLNYSANSMEETCDQEEWDDDLKE